MNCITKVCFNNHVFYITKEDIKFITESGILHHFVSSSSISLWNNTNTVLGYELVSNLSNGLINHSNLLNVYSKDKFKNFLHLIAHNIMNEVVITEIN